MREEVEISRRAWFTVGVSGPPARGIVRAGAWPRAHSFAIYISIGGRPVNLKEDVEQMPAWIGRLALLLEERNNYGSGTNRERARQMIQQARAHYQKKLSQAN